MSQKEELRQLLEQELETLHYVDEDKVLVRILVIEKLLGKIKLLGEVKEIS